MKIFALGDPHGQLPKNLSSIIKKNKIEIIICVGDIPPVPKKFVRGSFPRSFKRKADESFKRIIDKLCSYRIPVLILKGNMYTRKKGLELTRELFSQHKNLTNKMTGKIKIKGQDFIFFDMIWDDHPGFIEQNKRREGKLNRLLKKAKNPIVISHSPPFGYVDISNWNNKPAGSKILLNAIKKHKPKLFLCGHIHEAKGKAKIGKSIVYNLGCCGDYKILEV